MNRVENEGRANLALGLAIAALLTLVVLGAADADGPIWVLQGVLAAGAAILGWSARGEKLAGRPLVAVILGDLLFLAFIVGTVIEFA